MFNWHISWSWTLPTFYTNMIMTLTRLDSTDHGVFGHLTINGQAFDCVTLENHNLLIPEGSYKCSIYHSPRLNREVILLHDVPNRTMIEIHNANWEKQLEGCIAVGRERDGYAIDASQDTLEDLLVIAKKADDLAIRVV